MIIAKILSLLIVIHLLANIICIVLLFSFLSFFLSRLLCYFWATLCILTFCALHAFVLYILQNWVNGPAKSQVIPQYRKD